MASMATGNPIRQYLVSTIAALERHHPGDPRIPVLRAELATVGLADRIRQTLAAAPPLTAEQADRIRAELPTGRR